MATIEETKEMIKVMQAYVDGAEIEIETSNAQWEVITEPGWVWDPWSYRAKPQPRTLYAVFVDGSPEVFENLYDARDYVDYPDNWREYIVEFKEVINASTD